jgi:allophanate hydrolase
MVRPLSAEGCSAVELEVWEMPVENFGRFIQQVPPPLGIGTVDLEDGSTVHGFICEAWVGEAAAAGHDNVRDITHLGSWRRFLEVKQDAS